MGFWRRVAAKALERRAREDAEALEDLKRAAPDMWHLIQQRKLSKIMAEVVKAWEDLTDSTRRAHELARDIADAAGVRVAPELTQGSASAVDELARITRMVKSEYARHQRALAELERKIVN